MNISKIVLELKINEILQLNNNIVDSNKINEKNDNIINDNKVNNNDDNNNNAILNMNKKIKKKINRKIKIEKKYIKNNQQINLINQNNIKDIINFEKIFEDNNKDISSQRLKVLDLLGMKGVIKNNNSIKKSLELKDFEINSLE